MYFAYIHCKPDGSPFYVGKGNRSRVKDIRRDNKFHRDVVSKYGAENIKVVSAECETEARAFQAEIMVIEALRCMGFKLANQTDGGEGTSGWVAPAEFRQKRREASLGDKNPFFGKKHSPERLAEDSERAKRQWVETNIRALHSERASKLVGDKNPFYGRNHSEEYKQKSSEARRGKPGHAHSEEHKQHMSKLISGEGHHFYGKKLSPEHVAKMSVSMSKAAIGGRFMLDTEGKLRRVIRDRVDTRLSEGWVFNTKR